MGDSVPLKLALHGLKYPIGSEPNERFLQMGTHATNETHASPIAQQSTASPIFTPNQTQQVHAKFFWSFHVIFGSFCMCS